MLEILEFIFSSFWVFIGSIVFIVVLFSGLEDTIKAIRKATLIKEKQEEESCQNKS